MLQLVDPLRTGHDRPGALDRYGEAGWALNGLVGFGGFYVMFPEGLEASSWRFTLI